MTNNTKNRFNCIFYRDHNGKPKMEVVSRRRYNAIMWVNDRFGRRK